MESKLKALKVAELRQILSKANIQAPTKLTKADLVSKIQASQDALDAYAALYPSADDLLAPPEEIDWNSVDQAPSETQQSSTTAESVEPTPTPVPEPQPTSESNNASSEAPSTTNPSVDPEFEKRRQRAERFGIPLVEQRKQPAKKTPVSGKPTVDPAEVEARKARFGLSVAADSKPAQPVSASKKRPAPETKPLDPEEEERKRKRAERFGLAKCAYLYLIPSIPD